MKNDYKSMYEEMNGNIKILIERLKNNLKFKESFLPDYTVLSEMLIIREMIEQLERIAD